MSREKKFDGAALGAIRASRRMSRFELAVAVGVAPETIESWERGDSEPRFSSLIALCDALKIRNPRRFEHRLEPKGVGDE